jgi:hypothetical protein
VSDWRHRQKAINEQRFEVQKAEKKHGTTEVQERCARTRSFFGDLLSMLCDAFVSSTKTSPKRKKMTPPSNTEKAAFTDGELLLRRQRLLQAEVVANLNAVHDDFLALHTLDRCLSRLLHDEEHNEPEDEHDADPDEEESK